MILSLLSGFFALIFAGMLMFLTRREQKDISRLNASDLSLEEKEGIMRRMPTYEKSKRKALMMTVILILISIAFVAMHFINPPYE